jgi:hypothetical protein
MSHVERKSKYTKLAKLADNSADSVLQACARVLLPLADRIETITYDNGKEFASHAQIATSLGSLSYTHGNVASTNTPTAYSDSTSQKVPISLLCLISISKGSRTNSTLLLAATERDLAVIAAAVARARQPLRGKDQIGLKVGAVVNRYKMASPTTRVGC